MRSPLVLAYSNPPSCLCRVYFHRKLPCSTHVWVRLWPHRYHRKEQTLSEMALTITRQSLQGPYEAEERVPREGSIMSFDLSVVCIAQEKAKNHSRVLDGVLLNCLSLLGSWELQRRKRSSWQCFLWPGRCLGSRLAQVLLGHLTIHSHSPFLPDSWVSGERVVSRACRHIIVSFKSLCLWP